MVVQISAILSFEKYRFQQIRENKLSYKSVIFNFEPLDIPLFLLDGVEVAEGLAGVLVSAVASVYHRHTGVFGNDPGGAFPWMADNDDVGVAADYPCHIGDGFPFSHRG